ncbi:MAG: potassium efflux system protein [Candidatus Binatia bacterium]|jgi:potassium efflux system protein
MPHSVLLSSFRFLTLSALLWAVVGTAPWVAAAAGSILPAPSIAPAPVVPTAVLDDLAARIEIAGGEEAAQAALHDARAQGVRAAELYGRLQELADLRAKTPALIEETRKRVATDLGDPHEELPNGVSLERLREETARAELGLGATRAGLAEQQRELAEIADGRLRLPKTLAEVRVALNETELSLSGAPSVDAPVLVRAEYALAGARRQALELEVSVTQAELDSFDLRRELATLRRDLYFREETFFEIQLRKLQATLGSQRNADAMRILDEVRAESQAWVVSEPILAPIAERNFEIADARTGTSGLTTRIEAVELSAAETSGRLSKLAASFEVVRERARAVGFGDTIGLLLRKQRADLPDVERRRAAIRANEALLVELQLELFDLEESRSALYDIDRRVREIAQSAETEDQQRSLETGSRVLLARQRSLLDASLSDQEAYLTALVHLDAAERELVSSTIAYRDYIDEHVLWIRSTSLAPLFDIGAYAAACGWLLAPGNLSAAGDTFVRVAWTHSGSAASVTLGVLLLLVYRGRLSRFSRHVSGARGKDFGGPILGAFWALGATAIAASAWPALMCGLAWVLATGAGPGDEYARALSHGLWFTSIVGFSLELTRQFLAPGAIACSFFGWPGKALAAGRLTFTSAMVVGFPLLLVASILDGHSVEAWSNSLGRACYVTALVGFAIALRRGLAPTTALAQAATRRAAAAWSRRLAQHAGTLAPLVPALLALGAIAGFYFTTRDLAGRIQDTIVLFALLAFANGVALRWLALARGRLLRKTAEERRSTQGKAETSSGGGEAGFVVEETLDISIVGTQTRQLVRSALGVALVVGLWFVWTDVLPALRVLDTVEVWRVGGDAGPSLTPPGLPSVDVAMRDRAGQPDHLSVTLGDLAAAVIVLGFTIAATRNLPGFLELAVLPNTSMAPGVRYAVTSIARYLIATIGAVLTFGTLGLRWANVQWLVAAMTVGLGFGLQEIFANFVSGLIILFERPIRVGDTVTLGDVTGTVTRIRIRATTLLDWDRKELVVPNKEFITGQLINWTLSDPMVRLKVVVGVAYGSDTDLAEKLLYEVAAECDFVLKEPRPSVLFDEFGDNALTFNLRCFINGLDSLWQSQHALHMAVDRKFRDAGVEIAFPQRDLHLRSASTPLRVEILDRKDVV